MAFIHKNNLKLARSIKNETNCEMILKRLYELEPLISRDVPTLLIRASHVTHWRRSDAAQRSFDRILIAHAIAEGVAFVTHDQHISSYPLRTICDTVTNRSAFISGACLVRQPSLGRDRAEVVRLAA
jgi:hypothetical protein